MEQQANLVQCISCGKVREKFLVGCPKCGAVENKEIDSVEKTIYQVTLQTIQRGKQYYKKELTDEQRTWFSDRIPNGQSWQFYAGIVLINNLNTIWLKEIAEFEKWSEPISCGNCRAFFVMSFMTEEKQQNFCNLINTFNHQRIRDERAKREENQTDIQGEDTESNTRDS
jgi:hypothetical protein